MKFLYVFLLSLGIGITLSQMSNVSYHSDELVYLEYNETTGIHFESKEHPFFASSAEPVERIPKYADNDKEEETKSEPPHVSVISEPSEQSALEVKDAAMGILNALFRLFLEIYH